MAQDHNLVGTSVMQQSHKPLSVLVSYLNSFFRSSCTDVIMWIRAQQLPLIYFIKKRLPLIYSASPRWRITSMNSSSIFKTIYLNPRMNSFKAHPHGTTTSTWSPPTLDPARFACWMRVSQGIIDLMPWDDKPSSRLRYRHGVIPRVFHSNRLQLPS